MHHDQREGECQPGKHHYHRGNVDGERLQVDLEVLPDELIAPERGHSLTRRRPLACDLPAGRLEPPRFPSDDRDIGARPREESRGAYPMPLDPPVMIA